MDRAVFVVGFLASLVEVAGAAIAGCPPNSHPTEREGKTQYCECNDGYKNQSGSCTPIVSMRPSTRADCVRFAGYRLREDLQLCRSPIVNCLVNEGVRINIATCAGAAFVAALGVVDPEKITATAMEAIVAGALVQCTREAHDIAEKCAPTWATCRDGPLKAHTATVAECSRN
jgi:hypothetical protein